MRQIQGKWITFTLLESKTKTSVWGIVSKEGNVSLGQIKWFARWRKYSFFPAMGTVFEKTCLNEITQFMEKLMNDRKTEGVA